MNSSVQKQKYSVEWANFLLQNGIDVLKGSSFLLHPYKRLIIAVSVKEKLEKAGFPFQVDILEYWISEFIRYLYGKPVSHKFHLGIYDGVAIDSERIAEITAGVSSS